MKNLTALFLALMIILSAFSVSAYSNGNYKNGDVNRDGSTKIQDANLIQQYKASMKTLDGQQLILADYNMDGSVNIDDVTEIQIVLAEAKPAPDEEVNPVIRVYFSNNVNWSTVNFYFYNSSSGAPQKEWPGEQITDYNTNTNGEKVYYADVDTNKYDRVIFNNGTSQTVNVPVSKASSGFYISDSQNTNAMLVGTYAFTGADRGNMTRLNFDYPGGYKKRVWIWTPADYKTSGKSFRTIYMTDGQNLFDDDHEDSYGGWEVTDAVESMMSNGGRGVIIVGIESTGAVRDTELTPDIGELNPLLPRSDAQSFKNGKGIMFADFVVNTVMPYVQEHYNSSKQKRDNMICGSSSGGIESFYIGMEHNDKFGMIGALSPAFLLFGDDVWNSYLSKFDLSSGDMPGIYLFNGNNDEDSLEQNLKVFCDEMYNRLKKANYKNITYVVENEFKHNEAYWRIIFPDCISYLLGI